MVDDQDDGRDIIIITGRSFHLIRFDIGTSKKKSEFHQTANVPTASPPPSEISVGLIASDDNGMTHSEPRRTR